jgi:hypothetical protein
MTNALNQADIYTFGFTNAGLTSIMVIGDRASLKQCDGSIVKNIVAAANDPSPAPPNQLAAVNVKGAKFVWEYSGHVFISPGTNELFYTKRYEFNYVPDTQYFQLVNDNDYVNGCGVVYDSVCLVPMRRGWAVISGVNFDNFDASKFLNTARGVIAPHTIDKITYPTGEQTVVFLSDDGVHEIYIAVLEGGGRIYSTRAVMQETIDFAAIGLTEAEKATAVGYFDNENIRYMLSFQKAGVNYTWVYDTRNRQWYSDWLTFNAKSYVMLNTVLYFAGTLKHLCKFDEDLNTDWSNSTKTIGTPVHYKRYSPALSFEFSGFGSMWDGYLLESQQSYGIATLDVTFIFTNNTDVMEGVINGQVFVEGVSQWGYAKYANVNFTDLVNEPNEILFEYSRLSKYVQVLVENDRDEPVKQYREKFKGRNSGK